MGNCFSISMPCDAMATRCWDDCIRERAVYICNLEENLVALDKGFQEVKAKRDDVMTKVNIAEQQHLKRLNEVQLWLLRVAAVETEVAELNRDGPQEIEKLFLGGCCSKNCNSSYKFGKRVAQKLKDVIALKSDGDFKEVAEMVPAGPVDVKPIEPTVGLDSTVDKVWSCLQDENVGIIGLYGTGGVGKTTLLKQINNKLFDALHNFDHVIWVVVSKDLKLEKVQEDIGKKIGFSADRWKCKSPDEKATDIFKALRSKKFVLLLDDIWERVDLTEVGVPLPCQNNGSKIVFTSRSFQVCGQMKANENIEVKTLALEKALELFYMNVGEDTLFSHPKIPELAEIVAKECDGLPLALVIIGQAMTCKKTPEEWNHAIDVLRRDASEFPGMGKEVYSRLKFSYNNLPNEIVRSCFLYCSLFPEDFLINKLDLIDYWNCEGFLGEYNDRSRIQNLGYDIIGTILNACLLEEEDNHIKMHDVIRDAAIWIACEFEERKQKFLVRAGARLTTAPEVKGWERAKRVSLMANHIENLTEAPTCSSLLTLFLHDNHLKIIDNGFFQFMTSLRVLDLSKNRYLKELPLGISKLVSLEYLNLSETGIQHLGGELKKLVKLKYLNLERTSELISIPYQLISSFSKLEVLRMMHCNVQLSVKELLCFKHLNTLSMNITSKSTLRRFLDFQKLQSCTQKLYLCFLSSLEQLNVSSLANMKRLEELHIKECENLQELKIEWVSGGREIQFPNELHNSLILSEICFESLCEVSILDCHNMRDLTWLILAPNLTSLHVAGCDEMTEIISAEKLDEVPKVVEYLNPFAKLELLMLMGLPKLKSIYKSAMPFPHLKEIRVIVCSKLKKLPLNSNSAKERKIVIQGEKYWWKQLEWEDEATQKTFLPCFKDWTQSGTFMDGDVLVNRDGVRVVTQSQTEAPPPIKASDNQLNLADIDTIKVIGKGNGGIVQLVQHKWTGQFFALKVIQMNDDESARRMIAHDMKVYQSSQCPYVVVRYQIFYDNSAVSIILEYMDGGSLADFLKKVKTIPEPYLAAICKQVLKGLLYLHHEKHIIHRDLKLSNLLVNHRGEVKMTSFGLSAPMASTLGRANAFVGTYNYMSPEKISEQNYGYKSDIWSLGLVLLECATGKFPYTPPEEEEGWINFYELTEAIVKQPPPSAPSDQFSPEFCSFISVCIQKDPKDRHSAHELITHPFMNLYEDLNRDLASYFTNAGSPLATF